MDNKLKEWADALSNFTEALGEIVKYLQQEATKEK